MRGCDGLEDGDHQAAQLDAGPPLPPAREPRWSWWVDVRDARADDGIETRGLLERLAAVVGLRWRW